MTNGSRDDFQESEKFNFGSHLVEKLRKIEKFLKIFKKAEADTTRIKPYFWQNKNQQNAGISGCGSKTRTYDLRVMRVLSAIFEFY